jgi:hypothetical protein
VDVQLFELANELGMTSEQAAAWCAQLGIPAAHGGDAVSDVDAARLRQAVRPTPTTAESAPPSSAPATADPLHEAPGFASPHSAPPAAPPGPLAVPGAPTSGPFAPPSGAPAAPYAPATPSYAPPPGAPYAPFGPTPGAPPYGGATPSMASAEEMAQLASARRVATAAIRQGAIWIAGGIAVTIAFFAVAPGGFAIITFGPVIFGVRRIAAGRKLLAQVTQAERRLGVRDLPPGSPGSPGSLR